MIELNSIGAAAFTIVRRDDTFAYEKANVRLERLTGLSREAIIGRTPADLFPAAVADLLAASYRDCFTRREPVEFERAVPLPRGLIVTRTTLTPLFAPVDGAVQALLGVTVDVTEQGRLRENLRKLNARLNLVVDALGGAHWFYDPSTRRVELSPAFERLLGGPVPDAVTVEAFMGSVHPDDREKACFNTVLTGRVEEDTVEFRLLTRDGDIRWMRCQRRALMEGGRLDGVAGVVVDITRDKRREETLAQQAASDPLTGLPNRRRFEEVLAEASRRAEARSGALSVLMIDVDHFKAYNDAYGHLAGDAALQRLSGLLENEVNRVGGTAARYGGEEFVAVLPGLDAAFAARVAESILAAVQAASLPHAGSPTGHLTLSIGVACCPGGGRLPARADLVAHADAALYRAKRDGRACYRVRAAPHLRAAAVAPAA